MPVAVSSAKTPGLVVEGDALLHLKLLAAGAYRPLDGFLGGADTAAVRDTGRLADGTPWPVPVNLPVPAGLARYEPLELRNPEGVLSAVLDVREVWADRTSAYLAGPLRHEEGLSDGLFRRLRRTAAQARGECGASEVLGMTLTQPLHRHHLDIINRTAAAFGAEVLLMPLLSCDRPEVLVRATLAARAALPVGTRVVPIALPLADDADRRVLLHAHVAAAYGATRLLAAHTPDLSPIPLVQLIGMPSDDQREVHRLLEDGCKLPSRLTPRSVADELGRSHRPLAASGFTVLFTGLSGSGKSTIARELRDEILLRDARAVTLLDGDLVRRHLSAELGFSREDRSRNVRRIGWVAAEITRHGGIAVCSPIAPYAKDREVVRGLVAAAGGFLLVHVATPLEECERRDRKGLYARARAGLIPEFTGVSAGYEIPVDADVTLDTVACSVQECVDLVLKSLKSRGWCS